MTYYPKYADAYIALDKTIAIPLLLYHTGFYHLILSRRQMWAKIYNDPSRNKYHENSNQP